MLFKQQDQLENAEAGLSLAASVISEQPIKQTHPKLVAAASELHNTGYHKLAKVLAMKPFSSFILLNYALTLQLSCR